MTPDAPCDRCVSSPERIDVPSTSSGTLPASVAWLRSETPAGKGGVAGARAAPAVLSMVVLALAAQRRVTLLRVSHRPGAMSRLFGRSGSEAIHIAANESPREGDGAMERRLIEGVLRRTSARAPHGPSIADAIASLFPSIGVSPGFEIVRAAKEDAIARGVGRWLSEEEVASLTVDVSSSGLVDGFVQRLAQSLGFYRVLPAHEAAVASARSALDALHRGMADRNPTLLKTLEKGIQRGLDERTSKTE